MEYAEIGIIGGSGFYDLEGLEDAHHRQIDAPRSARLRKSSCWASCTAARWPFCPGTATAIASTLPK